MIGGVAEATRPRTPLESLINTSYFFPIYFLSTYVFINLVLPTFAFKRRYSAFFVCTIALLAFNFIACYFSGILYEHVEWGMPYKAINFQANKYHAIVNGLWVSFMFLGISGGIKTTKRWYQKERENEELAKQKISREIQLVRTQLHPDFLFHSLCTVQNHIDASSALAPTLILQLSELLSYILYESEQQSTLLEKELEIIQYYVELENKSGVTNGLTTIEITGNSSYKYVTPLLLFSVIEKTFENFRIKNNTTEDFTIQFDIKNDFVNLTINSNANVKADNINIKNSFITIEKQLSNLFPGNHVFTVTAKNECEIITVKLPIKKNDKKTTITASNEKEYELL